MLSRRFGIAKTVRPAQRRWWPLILITQSTDINNDLPWASRYCIWRLISPMCWVSASPAMIGCSFIEYPMSLKISRLSRSAGFGSHIPSWCLRRHRLVISSNRKWSVSDFRVQCTTEDWCPPRGELFRLACSGLQRFRSPQCKCSPALCRHGRCLLHVGLRSRLAHIKPIEVDDLNETLISSCLA